MAARALPPPPPPGATTPYSRGPPPMPAMPQVVRVTQHAPRTVHLDGSPLNDRQIRPIQHQQQLRLNLQQQQQQIVRGSAGASRRLLQSTELFARQSLTIYEVYTLYDGPRDPSIVNPRLSNAIIIRNQSDKEDILKAVKSLDEDGLSVTTKLNNLPPNQYRQVTIFLESKTKSEFDPAFTWTLVQLDSQFARNEAESVKVYLKRAPVAGINATLMYQQIEMAKVNSTRLREAQSIGNVGQTGPTQIYGGNSNTGGLKGVQPTEIVTGDRKKDNNGNTIIEIINSHNPKGRRKPSRFKSPIRNSSKKKSSTHRGVKLVRDESSDSETDTDSDSDSYSDSDSSFNSATAKKKRASRDRRGSTHRSRAPYRSQKKKDSSFKEIRDAYAAGFVAAAKADTVDKRLPYSTSPNQYSYADWDDGLYNATARGRRDIRGRDSLSYNADFSGRRFDEYPMKNSFNDITLDSLRRDDLRREELLRRDEMRIREAEDRLRRESMPLNARTRYTSIDQRRGSSYY